MRHGVAIGPAPRLVALDSLAVDFGEHGSAAEGVSIMEAVAYVAGEPWSSAPNCASPIVSTFLRRWADDLGPAGRDTRQTLKPYIVRLVGSAGATEQEDTRRWMAVDWFLRTQLPTWLLAAGAEVAAVQLERLQEVRAGVDHDAIEGALRDAGRVVATARQAFESVRVDITAGVLVAVRDALRAAGSTAIPTPWFPTPAVATAAHDLARDAAHLAAAEALGDSAGAGGGSTAAWASARDVLCPAVVYLQASAHRLVHRMLAVHEVTLGADAYKRWCRASA